MMAVAQIWLSLKLMEQVDAPITTLFERCCSMFRSSLVVFGQEQRDLLINPMKNGLQKFT